MKKLLTDYPELIAQWDYEKNQENPKTLKENSTKKVFWKCEKGHSWEVRITDRVRYKTGCPYCSNKKVLPGYNDLSTTNPNLASEWHPSKNNGLTPLQFTAGSGKRVWWKGECGHEWEAVIVNRSKGYGCPICAHKTLLKGFNDLETMNPVLAHEWHPTKNEPLLPRDVFPNTPKKVWWKGICGHEWEASIASRNRMKSGCPICSHRVFLKGTNDLETLFPEIAKEWHPIKNGTLLPEDVPSGDDRLVWWLGSCGHEWQTKVRYRTNNKSGCLICSSQELAIGINDLETINPLLASEWHPTKNGSLKASDVFPSSSQIVWWRCSKGHEWKASINSRTQGSGCPECNKESRTSFPEQCLFFYLHQAFSDAINGFKDLDNGISELDIYIPSLNVGIEYDGCFYHRDIERDERKNKAIEAAGIRLFRIKENIQFSGEVTCNQFRIIEVNPRNIKTLENAISLLLTLLGCRKNLKIDLKHDRMDIWELYIRQTKEKSLTYLYPEVAREWHPTKNGLLKPELFTTGTAKEVWWLCPEGHEYEASIASRTQMKSGCPVCSNTQVLKGYNDFETKAPEISKEWHPLKNGQLKPCDVVYSSTKKVWWLGACGHEWETKVSSRYQGSGCPICLNQLLVIGVNDLATKNPELALEWHPEKNEDLLPTDVSSGTPLKVWWLCSKCKHEWIAPVNRRNSGSGCPVCQNIVQRQKSYKTILTKNGSLLEKNPRLAKQWHPTKNGNLTPDAITSKSRQKVWWLGECGHEWLADVSSRNSGNGCPYCSNSILLRGFNDVATKSPHLAKQWHPTKNGDLLPADVIDGSTRKIWWKCDVCENEWETTVDKRKSGRGCPSCGRKNAKAKRLNKILRENGSLAEKNPNLALEWHPTKNKNLTPMDITSASNKNVWWLCKFGHEWEAKISNRHLLKQGCPYCSGRKKWINDFK